MDDRKQDIVLGRVSQVLAVILLSVVAVYNLFAGITLQQVDPWDEARHIASAIEMLHSHDWIVTTYMGQPDYWNVKPPLSEWASATGLTLFANPFLGARFFSLLAALGTILLAARYAWRLQGPVAGLLTATILMTAWPIYLGHAARTADADMLFICCLTGALTAFARADRYGLAAGYALLGLAFLAKSFHVMPFGLAAFLYSVWLWRQKQLRLAEILLLPGCFLIPVFPWALARYLADGPRFFELMFFYDVWQRTTGSLSAWSVEESKWLYVEVLLKGAGPTLVVMLMVIVARGRALSLNPRLLLPLLWLLVPLTVYTLAKTRLGWYIYPAFAPLAIIAGVLIVKEFSRLRSLPGLIVLMVLGAGFLIHESMIVRCIDESCFIQDRISRAMINLSPTISHGTADIYLNEFPTRIDQHYYATSLMLGNLVIRPGGKPAFSQSAGTVPFYLIMSDGRAIPSPSH